MQSDNMLIALPPEVIDFGLNAFEIVNKTWVQYTGFAIGILVSAQGGKIAAATFTWNVTVSMIGGAFFGLVTMVALAVLLKPLVSKWQILLNQAKNEQIQMLQALETVEAFDKEERQAAEKERQAEEEFKTLVISAENGNAEAQVKLGHFYAKSLEEPNREKAIKYFTMAAEQKNAEAQYELGHLEENIEKQAGVKRDYGAAFHLYVQSAAKGNMDAEVALGLMYEKGKVPNSDKKLNMKNAAAHFSKAAKQKHSIGTFHAARLFEKVNKHDNAYALYKKSADLGYAEALYSLGELVEKGLVKNVKKGEALGFYKQAEEKGIVRASSAILRFEENNKKSA